jgi:hypothetical protein
MHLVLFDMQNRTADPYLAAINRIIQQCTKRPIPLSGRPRGPQAVKYDQWSLEQRAANGVQRLAALAENEWTRIAPARLAEAQRRGAACFDRAFYVGANRFDLGFIDSQPDPQAAAWAHFVTAGIQEGRPYRFTC